VGDVDLNLRQLTIHDVDVNFGVGQVEIILPEAGKFDVSLDGGIGNVTIKVPEGMEVRVNMDTAIVARTIPNSYTQNDEIFKSPGYNNADSHANITVDLGIGNVTVKEYFGE
jgi:predicted membrane protein